MVALENNIWDGIFGFHGGGGKDAYSMMVRRAYNSSTRFQVLNYSTDYGSFDFPFSAPSVLHVEKDFTSLDGEGAKEFSHSVQTWTSPYNLWLGYVNNGNPSYGHIRVYGLKIYDAGDLVMDLIPKSDNGVVSLYDAVTRSDFFNLGAGELKFGIDDKGGGLSAGPCGPGASL